MSKGKTEFIVLPNEMIYSIFDFLTQVDIIRAFAQINRRYDDIVQCYIKRLDLTYGWQGDRQQLEWICETIETLKIDQFYTYIFDEQELSNGNNVTYSQTRKDLNFSERNRKSLWRSIIKKISTPFRKTVTSRRYASLQASYMLHYRFSRLHTVQFVDVSNMNNILTSMNWKRLSLWFNDYSHLECEGELIPRTITKFSRNMVLHTKIFHTNLIDLNVCVFTMVDLVELVKQTPNLQHLSVTFIENFDNYYHVENYHSDRFETITSNFCCLSNLNYLSFIAKDPEDRQNNETLPFNQIEVFIDRCCPNRTILKKVVLKLEYISFSQDMWSTIVRYKHTFDCFNFYASFITGKNTFKSIDILSTNIEFDFHIECYDTLYPQGRFIHIYSLPFAFDKLHGFTSCSELSPRCSFSTVRYLYFMQTRLNHHMSFESLIKRMPRLVLIDCYSTIQHAYNVNVPEVVIDEDIFNYVRVLRFTSYCWHRDCVCRNLLARLLDRMPHLECLTTSENRFIQTQRLLPPIQRLDMGYYDFKSIGIFVRNLPHLRTILFKCLPTFPEELSNVVTCLFIELQWLRSISFWFDPFYSYDQTPHKQRIEQALILIKKMNNDLHQLRLEFGWGIVRFYLPN